MPWPEQTRMSQGQECCEQATTGIVSMTEACLRFGVSRPTGYRWLARWQVDGADGLVDRSSCSATSPRQTPDTVAARVVALRLAHPTWGGRKLHHVLRRQGVAPGGDGEAMVPAPSTITDILRRAGLLATGDAVVRPWQRFVHAAPTTCGSSTAWATGP